MFDPADISRWLSIILSTITLLTTLWLFITRGAKDNSTRIEAVEKDVAENTTDIKSIRQELRHIPSKDMVHEIQVELTKVSGDITALTQNLGTLANTTRRIEDHILNKEK